MLKRAVIVSGLMLLSACQNPQETTTPDAALAFTLTVQKAGSGGGTLNSDVAGINCGASCSASYAAATVVRLTALAAPGSAFVGWNGSACGGTGDCVVTMSAARAVTAVFNLLPRHILNVNTSGPGAGIVSSTPAGIQCGTDCSEEFIQGSQVTLTATPTASSSFGGWGGACSGLGSCVVTLGSDTQVSATFTAQPQQRTLDVIRTGNGAVTSSPAGVDCGSACTASFDHGTVVTLSALAASGARFAGWSGACSGTAACSVTMDAARSVNALFSDIPRYLLSTSANNGGTVISDPAGINCGSDCTEEFLEATVVNLSVVEPSGFRFANWTGACTGSGACNVTMDAGKTVAAVFNAIERFTLSVIKAGAGTGSITSTPAGIDCGSDCTEDFDDGTTVTLTAVPTAGSSFGGWTGACTGNASCEVSMSAARDVTATFVTAVVTNALDFATDSRTADGADPGANVNPIISRAKPFGDATPVAGPDQNDTFIDANVFVPAYSAGQTFPVVLWSHGWGGNKGALARGTNLPEALSNEGYIVVKFSQRGWGASEGEIRIMDPAFEAQDAKAVIDWIVAEATASRLPVKMDSPSDPRIGTYGGSYGGGFQLNLAAEDARVDALAPDITWHDLRYSLIPNGLIKATWGNLLCAVGQAQPNRDEFLIKACDALPGASSTTRTKEGIETVVTGFHDFVYRHSMDYYETTSTSPVAGSPYARTMPPVLLTQGMRDNLFNGLEATHNFKFLSAISPDVRLFTHQSGHILPVGQAAAGAQTCGPINLIGNPQALTRKWFARYLKDDMAALDGVSRVCISLDASKAVLLDAVPEGGVPFSNVNQDVHTGNAPPPTNSVFKRLTTITTAGQVLAGIPRFNNVTVKCPIPAPGVCPPVTPADEPIALVGIGLKRGAAITLMDEQVTPIRTMGSPHTRVELPMVGEALNVGDEIGLMFYTVHGQYKVEAGSMGGNSPPVAGPNDQYNISIGSVELPIFMPVTGSVVP